MINFIGITSDGIPDELVCSAVKYSGLQAFVGGASDGRSGVATMNFTSPYNNTLYYKKSWFFFDDIYVVITTDIKQVSNKDVFSVLDNREMSTAGQVTTPQGVAQSGTLQVVFELNEYKTDIDMYRIPAFYTKGHWVGSFLPVFR